MLKWKSKVLLAKVETAYGVDAVPTAAANAIMAMDVSLSPMEGQDAVRNIERPQLGARPSVPTGIYSTLTFSVDAVGSGVIAQAPAWGPLMRGCGIAQVITPATSVEYTPVTDGHESLSLYLQVDSTRHVLAGARGTVQLRLNAQGLPVFTYTFTGLFSMPTEQAKPNPDYSAWKAPQVASKANTPTFTIGGTAMVLRDFAFDLANEVQPRMLIGSEQVLITDRNETLAASVEAVPVTVYNPYAIASEQTPQAIALVHGTDAATRFRLDLPSAQLARLSGLDTGNQNIVEWPLRFSPQPVAGDDQWKLTLS